MATKHSVTYCDNIITFNGVTSVSALTEREAVLRLDGQTVTVRGSGLNVTSIDKDKGVAVIEVEKLVSVTYKDGFSLKGLLK